MPLAGAAKRKQRTRTPGVSERAGFGGHVSKSAADQICINQFSHNESLFTLPAMCVHAVHRQTHKYTHLHYNAHGPQHTIANNNNTVSCPESTWCTRRERWIAHGSWVGDATSRMGGTGSLWHHASNISGVATLRRRRALRAASRGQLLSGEARTRACERASWRVAAHPCIDSAAAVASPRLAPLEQLEVAAY